MLPKVTLLFFLAFASANAIDNFPSKTERGDEDQPKYEYQYDVPNEKNGTGQGKFETREGIHASGRYYVQGENSSQNVEYVADESGYHSYIQYSSTAPHSQTTTHVAHDAESIKTLKHKNNKEGGSTTVVSTTIAPTPEVREIADEASPLPDKKTILIPVRENFSQDINFLTPQQAIPSSPATIYPQEQMVLIPVHQIVAQEQNQVSNQLAEGVFLQNVQRATQFVLQPFYQDQNSLLFLQDGHKYDTAPLYQTEDNLVSTVENYGEYGSKIHPFKKLVTGQDVLNINQAIDTNLQGESSTPISTTAFISEYAPPTANSDGIGSTFPLDLSSSKTRSIPVISTSTRSLPGSSFISSLSLEGTTESFSLSKQPIIVEDYESEDEKNEVSITPRPSNGNFLTSPLQKNPSDVTTETNVVVDVQQSIPYYLGRIEYYQNHEKRENFSSEADQVQEQGEMGPTVVQNPYDKQIEKAVEVVPQPYPVEVEKIVKKPIETEITKYVDKPYPIPVQVHQPHPVEMERTKLVPQPIEVTKYVDRPYPVQIPVHIQHQVEVTKYVDRPYPVRVEVPKLYPVEKIVEKPYPVEKPIAVPQYIPKPYPVTIKIPVPITQAFYIPVEVAKPYPVQVTKFINKPFPVYQPYPVQVPIEVRVPHLVPVHATKLLKPVSYKSPTRIYSSSHAYQRIKTPCVDLTMLGVQKPYCGLNYHNYLGLMPPKIPATSYANVTKLRRPRQNFDDNVRLEYGFMPPLIPSLAIDENGNPIERHTK